MFLKTNMAGSVCWESTRKECSMVNEMVYIDVGPFISRVRLDGTPAVIAGTSTIKVIAGTSVDRRRLWLTHILGYPRP